MSKRSSATGSLKPVCYCWLVKGVRGGGARLSCGGRARTVVDIASDWIVIFVLFQSGGYTLDKEKPGQAMCPYDPHHNSTAVYVGKWDYSGENGMHEKRNTRAR